MPSFNAAVRGLAGTLVLSLLLVACQSDAPQRTQDREPALPDGKLAIEEPWVRPASQGDSTALYMTIANGTSSPDTLVGARQAPLYESVQLFVRTDTSDTARAQPVDSLIVPAKTRMTLAPDSAYVVLNGLSQPVEKGGTFLVTMDFAQRGLLQVQAAVRTSAPMDEQP